MSTSRQRRRALPVALLALASLASWGCVEHSLREGRMPMDYAAYDVPEPPAPSEGSLWPGETRSGSFLFFDEKARRVGDLVTVQIVENTSAQAVGKTELESTSSISNVLSSDVGFQKLIQKPIEAVLKLLGLKGAGRDVVDGEDLNVLTSQNDSSYEGDGTTERSGTFSGVITCRVIDVLPGDVLHIRGRRYVIVNHEAQFISLEGLVRREDIDINNTVPSTVLAEARITYDGLGVIDDKQRPGILARVFDWVYPF